ncbi:glycosyltransferase family 2 protein [Arthrobacter castelli]|uniref:glycosyltransferase family 2 protein n=1 Tax=Arthrobacter castelli TaxID=271431 RepID=UPI00047C7BE8|nr:glycosyltransferase family A protein [Arthrobacter castelli]
MPNAEAVSSPDVDVIVATRDRHELLLQTIDGIIGQDYPGTIRVTIVYDYSPVRTDIARNQKDRIVRTAENSRTRGLAGARNTGIMMSDAEMVAFCDDDDVWRTEKLSHQVAAMSEQRSIACVSGIEVHYAGKRHPRIPEVPQITVAALSRSRLTGAHPSTYLFQRTTLVNQIGLVDEKLPHGYGEDLDLLLRAAAHGPVAVVRTATTDVLWHDGSYFSQRWAGMAAGLNYLLGKHPSIAENRKGTAWLEGQRAFALAATGTRRREALATAARSLKGNILEPRGYLAVGIVFGLLKPDTIMKSLNARGRGI